MATRQRTRKQKEKEEQERKEKEQEADDYLAERRYLDGSVRPWSAESQQRLAITAAEERIRNSPCIDNILNPLWIPTMRYPVQAMEELERRRLEKAELEEERRQIEEEGRRQFEEEEEQRRAAEERRRELEISRACIREKLSRCEFPISLAARYREPDQQRSDEVEAPMEQGENEQGQSDLVATPCQAKPGEEERRNQQDSMPILTSAEERERKKQISSTPTPNLTQQAANHSELANSEKTLEELYEEEQLEIQRMEKQKRASDEKRRQREKRRAENKLRLEAVETWLRSCEEHMRRQHEASHGSWIHEKIGPIGPQPEAWTRKIAEAKQLEKELDFHFGYPLPK